MKRVLFLFLVLVLSLSLVGCEDVRESLKDGIEKAQDALGDDDENDKDQEDKDEDEDQDDDEKDIDDEDEDGDEDLDEDDEDTEDKDQDQDNDDDHSGNSDDVAAIYCNDTVKVDMEGLEVVYTLVMLANKIPGSGEGDFGTYEGNIYLTYGLDASQLTGMNGAPMIGEGGFNVTMSAEAVTFEVVKLNPTEYEQYGKPVDPNEDMPLAALISGNAMAMFTAEMSGSSELGITITGLIDSNGGTIKGEQPDVSASGAAPLVFKLYVNEGSATITIMELLESMQYKSFDGILSHDEGIISQAETQVEQSLDSEE